MTTVQLTESELRAMASAAGAVADAVRSVNRMVPDGGDVRLKGFKTSAALDTVSAQWETKVRVNANDWQYFGKALSQTAGHVVATDDRNSFYFPQ